MNFFIPGHAAKLVIKDSILNVRIKRIGKVKGKKTILIPKKIPQTKADNNAFFRHTILRNIEFLKISFIGREIVVSKG